MTGLAIAAGMSNARKAGQAWPAKLLVIEAAHVYIELAIIARHALCSIRDLCYVLMLQ